MKPKKLIRDIKPQEANGTYSFGKNGLWNAQIEALQNEKGFRLSSAVIPYYPNGVIETDGDPIIFSTDNTYSAFGFYNEATDTYIPIFDDNGKNFKLGFRTENYIKGEYRRNYKSEIEITWLDKLNPPRFANTSDLPDSASGFLLFPEGVAPILDASIISGGSLEMGVYFVGAKYLSNDGTETRYFTLSSPVSAYAEKHGAVAGGNTGKSLKIEIKQADPQYDKVQVVIVKRSEGITSAVELPEITLAVGSTIIYNGTGGTDITLEEVLIPAAFYENSGSITQLNDILYLADMVEAQNFDYQPYANMVKVRWSSELKNIADSDIRSGKKKTYKHREVYALYIVLHMTNGLASKAFTIPGVYDASKMANVTIDGVTDKKYKMEDTATILSATDKIGYTGMWVNEVEKYPDTPSFDSTSIGGPNLRNQPVRHHKMPSLIQTRPLHTSTSSGVFGVDALDIIGLTLENVIIPIQLQGKVSGYEIFYAKRDYTNCTMPAQGALLFGGRFSKQNSDPNSGFYSSGGNWDSQGNDNSSNSSREKRALWLDRSNFRFHSFDLMFNRPALIPSYMLLNYRLGVSNDYIVDNNDQMINVCLDYIATNKTSVYGDNYIRKMENSQYILSNQNTGPYNNFKAEATYIGRFPSGSSIALNWQRQFREVDNGAANNPVDLEELYLSDLVTLKTDLYSPFYTQDIVRSGIVEDLDSPSGLPVYGGDCFIAVYDFNTMGLLNDQDRYTEGNAPIDYYNGIIREYDGNKAARRLVVESISNLWQRYVDPSNNASKFFSANSDGAYLKDLSRFNDPNQYQYDKSGNSVGDLLNGITPNNPNSINISKSPYKIIRSTKQSREGKINSWKNFNSLDYYEIRKNMGPIINIQAYGDKLIIHCKNALFITRDKTTLQGDILSVTLGSGDIFTLEPQEGKPSKMGYGGAQLQLACVMTDAGYVFPDVATGDWFILNEQGLRPITVGLDNFMSKYLTAVTGENTFIGNGVTVGYDKRNSRIIITVKNKQSLNTLYIVDGYEPTPEFFSTLTPNQSVVFKDGVYQLYKGLNTSEYACPVYVGPVLGDYTFEIDELSDPGTNVGTVSANQSPVMYLITAGNTNGAFVINSSTGKITVSNKSQLDRELQESFVLTVKATNSNNLSDTGAVTINLVAVNKAPEVPDYEVDLSASSVNGVTLVTVEATDPEEDELVYSIIGQPYEGMFSIDPSTGELILVDNTELAYDEDTPEVNSMDVLVQASDGDKAGTGTVTVNIIQHVCTLDVQFEVVRGSMNLVNITALPELGDEPFTYLWGGGETTDTLTDVSAGEEYTVTVTDSRGCVVTKSITPAAAAISGLKIELMYFEQLAADNNTDIYANRLGVGGHTCNRARFKVLANGTEIGIANLNNADGTSIPDGTIDDNNIPPGTYSNPSSYDRYWSKVLTGAEALDIADESGIVTFTLEYTGIDNNPHTDAAWLRITKENGTILVSATLNIVSEYEFDPYDV